MGSKISYLTFVMIFLYKDSVVQWYKRNQALCGSVKEHQSMDSVGLRFVSSGGISVGPLSHARDKMKKSLSIYINQADKFIIFVLYLVTSLIFSISRKLSSAKKNIFIK